VRRALIFDPLEWNYVITLARRSLPMLNFDADPLATEAASRICGGSIDELSKFDWSNPVIFMPPFEKVVEGSVRIAVEGYTAEKMARLGVKPDIVVTDLDFDVGGVGYGEYAVIHAHGDNVSLLLKYADMFKRRIMTVQTWPLPCTTNISGFTDGDRAVYLAYYMGATRITISGAYFDAHIKRRDYVKEVKLEIAKHLIRRIGRRIRISFI